MTCDEREMSMRSNNMPYAHVTSLHEMIPGRFLKFCMAARYRPYRRSFFTPFWIEGNAMSWEMTFWDKGWDATPAERIGGFRYLALSFPANEVQCGST
jgi:hypothetical protein